MAQVVLDAGVIIGLLDSDDSHHRSAVDFFQKVGSDEMVLPVSAYAECLVAPSSVGISAVRKVDEALGDLGIRLVDATPSIAKRAAMLRAKHQGKLRLPDALVVATALQLEADLIVTTDEGWPRLASVRVRVLRHEPA